jgi:hypothetical protein
MNLFKSIALLTVFTLFSCTKEVGPQFPTGNIQSEFNNGYWIANEGIFNAGLASVSFFHKEKNVMDNNVFSHVNKKPLGDVLQSMYFHNNLIFMAVNNSNKVVICNKDLKEVEVIDQLVSPRYITAINDHQILITSLGGEDIYQYDLLSKELQSWFKTEAWTEKIFHLNNQIFVCQKAKGFSDSPLNKILKLDQEGNLLTSFEINHPISDFIKIDENKMAVLVKDKEVSKLIILSSSGIQNTITLPEVANKLSVSNNKLYLAGEWIQEFNLDNNQLQKLFKLPKKTLYGFLVHDNNVAITDAKDYVKKGDLLFYNFQGNLVDSIPTGNIPSEIYWTL